ncbi:MAG TPA: glycosyltransferase [Nitrolancea sp.]|nr:glycosyltransferase [Nitrolancea sp.]
MSEAENSLLPLAIIVLTLNEERHLRGCLASAAGLAERLLVVDSGSQDRTAEIARISGADVVDRPFKGFASQRNAALDLVDQPWVLFLDADERVTPALRREIQNAIQQAPDNVAGYWLPRRNWMFGRELHGGGWWPDYQLRLLRRDHARYQVTREVHEVVNLDGEAGRLTEPLRHLNYNSIAEFREKQVRYAHLRVDVLRGEGHYPRKRTFIGQPVREFWRRFVNLGGYRDRMLGLFLATAMAWYELRSWLWLHQRLEADRDQKPAIISQQEGHMADLGPARDGLDLSLIIVSYNVRDLLISCLESIRASLASSRLNSEIIVVDNASSDGSPDAVRQRFPSVRLIENGANLGFAAANNRGILDAGGRTLLLLNPDTTVPPGAMETLTGYLDDHPDTGVVGPRLAYPDGSTQPSRRRFPNLLTGLLESTIVQDYWRENPAARRYYLADQPEGVTQDVDWLVGACLAVRREVIDQVGLLDDAFFMYSEETEWCHRVRKAGWRIVYLPEATIVHHEGASSLQDVPARQINFDTSRVLLFERLYGRRVAQLLRGYLLGTYIARLGIEGTKGLIGHKRALRRTRVALYWRALTNGLRTGGLR